MGSLCVPVQKFSVHFCLCEFNVEVSGVSYTRIWCLELQRNLPMSEKTKVCHKES